MKKNKYVLADTINNQAKSISARVWKRTRNDAYYLAQSKPVIDVCKSYYIGVSGAKVVAASIVDPQIIVANDKIATCNLYVSPKQALLNKRVSSAIENVRTL